MGKYVTVSVKIPRDVKEKLERAGVSPSKVMKDAFSDVLVTEDNKLKKKIRKDVKVSSVEELANTLKH